MRSPERARAAHVHAHVLRTRPATDEEVGEDRFLLAPIVERLNAAFADLLDFHVATYGAVGIEVAVEHLALMRDSLPSVPLGGAFTAPGPLRRMA